MKSSVLFPWALALGLFAASAQGADEDGAAASPDKKSEASTKVRYRKRTQVDFSSQTIEGKVRRPETSLISASEGVNDQGVLRLRENFLDKLAAFSGEDVK